MNQNEIVSKLWNLCNVLRDDGITYHQYVTELTYILFLKLMEEKGEDEKIDEGYRWADLNSKSGIELVEFYEELLKTLGKSKTKIIRAIYINAKSYIEEPANLKKIITEINNFDFYANDKEAFGDLYEGLLEKNASETKSGAGQYFTPRVLIDVMVELTDPKYMEKCNDPACGTFGFMIAVNKYLQENYDIHELTEEQQDKHYVEMLTGAELVKDTHRLALMNAMLHGLESDIKHCDTLSSDGENIKGFDVVLANPPFGTKKGGERATRSDLLISTSNKQLNFLQHIYRSLKNNTSARASVVLPDNVLFAEGDGAEVRKDLMNKCNLHTILRLPTGIFYAQGVKTNVLFFNRGASDENSTKEVYIYDLRTNMPTFGKTKPLTKEHFKEFIEFYKAEDRTKIEDDRVTKYTIEEIAEKNYSLDLGLIQDDSIVDYEDLQDPIESGLEIVDKLEEATDLIKSVIKDLEKLTKENAGDK